MASPRPRMRTRISAATNSWMLTANAPTMPGRASAKTGPLRNDSWTLDQPGAFVTTQARPPKTTAVLARAMIDARTARRRSVRRRTSEPVTGEGPRALRLEDRDGVLEREELAGQRVEGAVAVEGGDRIVDARR